MQEQYQYREQQTVIEPGSKANLIGGDTSQIKIGQGFYDANKSRIFVTYKFNSPAATSELYHRKDMFYGLQGQNTVDKEGEQICVYEDLTACQFAYYHSVLHNQKQLQFLTNDGRNPYNDDIEFLQTGTAAANTEITVSYPLKHFIPYLVTPTEKYLKVDGDITITLTLQTVEGLLIERVILDNTLSTFAVIDVTFDASMCLLPNFEAPVSMQSNVESHSITSTSQYFKFSANEGRMTEFQQLFFYSPAFSIISYGSIDYDDMKVDGLSSVKIKKCGLNITDNKYNQNYDTGNNAGQEAISDFILQLNEQNPKLNGTFAICNQKNLFQNSSLEYRIDITGTGLVINYLVQYYKEDITPQITEL